MVIVGLNIAHIIALIGITLVIAEAFIPGADMMVIGTALLVGGLVGLYAGIGAPITAKNIFFLSVVIVASGGVAFYFYRKYLRNQGKGSETTTADDLRGAVGVVVETVTPDSGRIRLQAGSRSEYQARTTSGTIETETEVVVTDPGGGSLLQVKPKHEKTQSPEEDIES